MNQGQQIPDAELNGQFANPAGTMVSELTAVLRDIESNLLAAFDTYARLDAARLSADDVTYEELLARISELETRRPPAA